jgi:hypothetical protein
VVNGLALRAGGAYGASSYKSNEAECSYVTWGADLEGMVECV